MKQIFFRLKWDPRYVVQISAVSNLPIPPDIEFHSLEQAQQERDQRGAEVFLIEAYEKEVA